MLLTGGQGVSIIPSLSLNCVVNMWGHSAIVEITLDFGLGSLNSRTYHGLWAMEPSIWVSRSCNGKKKSSGFMVPAAGSFFF